MEELHKPALTNFQTRAVIIKALENLWQADIVEMGAYCSDNDAYRYLITVINTFSKFAYVLPLKTKTGVEVTKAMRTVLMKGNPSKNLQTDDRREFFNNHFRKLMNEYKINHYSTYSFLKASIVERFNRTLESMMWKEFSFNGSFQ